MVQEHGSLGVATIGRDFARGPANVSLNLRLSRSWSFGRKSESTLGDFGGGPPPGMFGGSSGNKYSLTLSASFRIVLNHPNYGTPDGNLSSPFFGESLSLAGFGPMGAATTYNRKIDLQLRFTF